MPFDVVGAMARDVQRQLDLAEAEVRAAFGLPPAQVGATCRQCMAGEGHLDVACVDDPAYQRLPRADVLDQIDATVEGRCAGPGCSMPLTADSPSAWFCSQECQTAYHRQGTIRPQEVRGSTEVAPGPARWRPDLVDVFDDTNLELVREQPGRVFSRRHLTRRWYRYRHSDEWFFRLDDGNRFVGVEVAAEVAADDEAALAVWGRLERELADRRRLDPDPVPRPANSWSDVLARMGEAFDREVLGNRAREVRLPTAAERAGAYAELAAGPGPYGFHGQAVRQQRQALCDWLRANGIDPDWVPVDASAECDGRTIRCQVFVARGYDGRPVRSWVSVPMPVPPAPTAGVSFEGWEQS